MNFVLEMWHKSRWYFYWIAKPGEHVKVSGYKTILTQFRHFLSGRFHTLAALARMKILRYSFAGDS
jgi:hypothetical protein